MLLACVLLLVIGYLLTPVFARVVTISKAYLVPLMLIFAVGGTYVYRSNPMDLYFMIGFGLFGYGARKLHFDLTPLVMGFILTPPLEYALAQSMLLSRGDLLGYLVGTRPIAVGILVLTPVLIFWLGYRQRKQRRVRP